MPKGWRTRRLRSGLPVYGSGAQAALLLPRNEARAGVVLKNEGTGTLWISDTSYDADNAFPVKANDTLNALQSTAPEEPVYAWGETGYDVRILEAFGHVISGEAPRVR